ncbi:MAG: hypothetical protein AM326_00675 [Candidatus Thorarchaeota archaeon SMTZ-45]|nr:MAG: hypothetical protein AM326_00675 [Candidatus Thorarchaeota archaeon SMTZ-45]
MEIPVLTRFIKGLRLFFESKRLRWFTLIFLLSAIFVFVLRELGNIWPTTGLITVLGGVFPTYFMIAAFLALFGLQRFLADEESYGKSFALFIPSIIASIVLYVFLFIFANALWFFIFFWIAFFGWIVFQAFISSRSALGYAESVDIKHRSKAITVFFGTLYLASYFIIIGAFIVMLILNPAIFVTETGLLVVVAAGIGVIIAAGYNFLNGILILRYRNKVMGDNLALLGLFIALYVAYFLYNVLKPDPTGIDLFSSIIDIGISVFFILYAMSSVGLTLSARAELETRWKISKELAAAITFFLASGYLVVEAAFESAGFAIFERGPDLIKLILFPGVALLMALLFIRRAGRAPPEPAPMPEDAPVLTEKLETEEETEDETLIPEAKFESDSDAEEHYEEDEPVMDDDSDDAE